MWLAGGQIVQPLRYAWIACRWHRFREFNSTPEVWHHNVLICIIQRSNQKSVSRSQVQCMTNDARIKGIRRRFLLVDSFLFAHLLHLVLHLYSCEHVLIFWLCTQTNCDSDSCQGARHNVYHGCRRSMIVASALKRGTKWRDLYSARPARKTLLRYHLLQ